MKNKKIIDYIIVLVKTFGCLILTSIVSLIILNIIDVPNKDIIKMFIMPVFCIPFTTAFLCWDEKDKISELKTALFSFNSFDILYSIQFIFASVFCLLLISTLLGAISGQTDMTTYNSINPVLFFIASCIMAPVEEEILYRGILCKDDNKINSVLVALAFAAFHFSLIDSPYLIALSLLSSYAYHKYHSIYPSIAIHFLCNTVMFGVAYNIL